ncbi:MAG: hypothetical protein ACRD3Q_03520 [Terriglobales bacterium]
MTFEDLDDTNEAHERRIVRCRACQARIIFLESPATGKRVPVDADTVEADDQAYDSSRHVSHFTTCSDPNRFSKGRRSS